MPSSLCSSCPFIRGRVTEAALLFESHSLCATSAHEDIKHGDQNNRPAFEGFLRWRRTTMDGKSAAEIQMPRQQLLKTSENPGMGDIFFLFSF
ncbi:hypothetical protein CDAR_312291 [Caerostris darwini]|uniref:Uncharacterized protein n=1 Tax=Caerostris darwini TaxID=1538125 RepID=A0AAV4QSA4_9ARAC|nr:hypothetical protein CDAR_312291 [Caerostris darwini]